MPQKLVLSESPALGFVIEPGKKLWVEGKYLCLENEGACWKRHLQALADNLVLLTSQPPASPVQSQALARAPQHSEQWLPGPVPPLLQRPSQMDSRRKWGKVRLRYNFLPGEGTYCCRAENWPLLFLSWCSKLLVPADLKHFSSCTP